MPAKNDAQNTTQALTALLHSAEMLIAARRDNMLTYEEWGWDVQPTTDAAKRIVDLLAAGLAETVYGK